MWWLIPAALAAPLGSPAPVQSLGALRVSVSASGERAPTSDASLLPSVRSPDGTLRVDLVPVDGLGVWADASLRSGRVSSGTSHGWSLGGGLRGAAWLTRAVGLGLQARGRYGLDWTRGGDGDVDGWYRRVALRSAATVIVGPRDGGVWAWAGARATLWGNESLDVVSEGISWDLGEAHPLGLVLGGEVHSSDLRGPGLPGELRLSLGFEVHLVDVAGIAVWVGISPS